MGNCLAFYKVNSRSCIVKVAKPDGKVLEFSTPTHVKDILANFPSFGLGVSKEPLEPLSPEYELKAGRLYYLIPCQISTSDLVAASEGSQVSGMKRIKVVITKQQLEQLVTKQISIDDILLMSDLPHDRRKPRLDSIPEENE